MCTNLVLKNNQQVFWSYYRMSPTLEEEQKKVRLGNLNT